MMGLANLFSSSKGVLALAGIVGATVLGAIGKVNADVALGAIVFLATGYNAARAWTDRAAIASESDDD